MTFDVDKARADTPGCAEVAHFNNAGAALPPAVVTEAIIDHLRLEARIGGYEAAAARADQLEALYPALARLLGCDADEVAVVDSGTRAWLLAFHSIAWRPGDRVLTARAEYASNYISFLQVARRAGVKVEVIPDDMHGQLSVDALEHMIDDRVRLVAITHVPTNGGLVNPAEAVGAITREAGIAYLLDAVQSVGQMPIDVERLGCDFLAATGRKFLRAPRGTGFLYVRRDLADGLEPPMLDLNGAHWVDDDSYEVRNDARRFELWESNVAARLGMLAAVEYALSWGLEAIEARVTSLAEQLRSGLAKVPGACVRDLGQRRCGIVTFTLEGVDPDDIKQSLAAERVNVSVSRIRSTRLDMTRRGLDAVVRASVHYYNSEDEVDRLLKAVEAVAH